MKKLRHKILSVIMSIALLATMTLTNQGLSGFNFNVSAEDPIHCALIASLPDSVRAEFSNGAQIVDATIMGENITMTISPNAGYILNTLTANDFNVSSGTGISYADNKLNFTVTGDVDISIKDGVIPATLEEYNGMRLDFTGTVVMTNENITVDANIVTWANKSGGLDDTVSYGDTVIIPVYAIGYTISGTPTITINNGAFQVTGAYSNGNVTFTMPDIGDNNAEITSLVIDDLTASPQGYNRPFDKEAMKIYSNVPAPTDGTVNLTGLTADTDGTFEMKGDTGYYAEIIPPAPNATYNVGSELFCAAAPDQSLHYYTDQQTCILINDASGKTTGIYFKVTPQYIEDNKYMLQFKITLTDVVIPSSEKSITSFAIGTAKGTIDEANHNIEVSVPYGTDVTNLTPTIAVSDKATVSPLSGALQNFTDSVTYTVTAQDLTTQEYNVTVTVANAPSTTPPAPTPDAEPTQIKAVEVIQAPVSIPSQKLISVVPVGNAFSQSVEVRMKDDSAVKKAIEDSLDSVFKEELTGAKVFPLDISLYIKGTDTKIQPADGTSVTITCPIPTALLANKDSIKVVCIIDGKLKVLETKIVQIDGVWCVQFNATHFSPYAMVVDSNNIISNKAIANSVPKMPISEPLTIQNSNPSTGGNSPVVPIALLAILSMSTLKVISKKRKFNVTKKV